MTKQTISSLVVVVVVVVVVAAWGCQPTSPSPPSAAPVVIAATDASSSALIVVDGGGGSSSSGVAAAAAKKEDELTYEEALNRLANGDRSDAGPDLTDSQLSGPTRNATFLAKCGAPDAMKVTVRIVVHMGRAAGVSVYTSPSDPDVASCVDRHVRTLTWPKSGKLDAFTTTY